MALYSIGQLSKISGCHIESIRQYERKGLIKEPNRTESGHRRYSKHHLSVLTIILQLRKADFSLKDIKEVLDDMNQNFAPCGKIETHALKYSQIIENKRRALILCEKLLDDMCSTCLSCHNNSQATVFDNCPLIENLSDFA